ncbi:hypothetical protein [Thermoactinomyces sp. DSM 45892]|uniref:hypothetical protein n=1 Tax=Thermoactinomyces sp. DSM 45892 TaxID=1882753 RepID=UPI00089DA439|nr:hypothetical protein [Thermoactinomyces sp. DSM 45892]SDY35633.1 hypothetical protein SAMN05444416_10422 [Thermoactinomyces sp. DSM 45892]
MLTVVSIVHSLVYHGLGGNGWNHIIGQYPVNILTTGKGTVYKPEMACVNRDGVFLKNTIRSLTVLMAANKTANEFANKP